MNEPISILEKKEKNKQYTNQPQKNDNKSFANMQHRTQPQWKIHIYLISTVFECKLATKW